MTCYIENHISRKLKLIDTLYYAKTTPSIETLSAAINVSELTVRKYLKDYNLNYRHETLSLNQRQACYDTILSESLFYKILFLLFTSPGLSASDYSYQLAISTVNFYKQIKKLNEELGVYGIKTIVHDGYHLDCEDETLLYSVMFYYIASYNTENKALFEKINPLYSVIKKNDIHVALFEFDKDWERRSLCAFLWICLVRESHGLNKKNTALKGAYETHISLELEDVNEILKVVPDARFEQMYSALNLMKQMTQEQPVNITSITDTVISYYELKTGIVMRSFECDPLQSLQNLIQYGHQLITIFPFDLNGCSFVLKDFYQDYQMMNAEFTEHFEALLMICTQVTCIPFTYYRELLFYWFITQGGEQALLSHKKVLVVKKSSSDDGNLNTQELNQLLRLIKIQGVFSEISEQEFVSDTHCVDYDLIISYVEMEKHHKIIQKTSRNESHLMKSVFDYFQTQS